jgi:hypothetical protein
MESFITIILSVVLPLIGIAIGAGITWIVAHKYYKKAGDDLKKETDRLRNLNILIIRGIEEAGLAKFNRDKDGNPIGLTLQVSVVDGIVVKEDVSGNSTSKQEK